MPSVLILGAGLVSRPIVRYLLDTTDVSVTVASLYLEDAEALVDGHPSGRAIVVDVEDDAALASVVEGHDVVVSLVPYAFHPRVARLAIPRGVHVVTASYVSDAMRELDAAAREAGVMILNEVGLDPGLDHMSALHVIDDVHRRGGEVVSFSSCTGGLPAPEAADNPWRYKISWSPRGAVQAGLQAARYRVDGRDVEVAGPVLFESARTFEVEGVGEFEMYPNRDSLPYAERYRIGSTRSLLRGTIRYPGWSRAMAALVRLGLFERPVPADATRAAWTCAGLPDAATPRARVAAFLDLPEDHDVVERIAWIGLLDDERPGDGDRSGVDVLASLFSERLAYDDGERDMVLMRHEIVARYPDGTHETTLSILEEYGEPDGDSAMARTVSMPAAIATERILRGDDVLPGVRIPDRRELYAPMLVALASHGIRFRETTTRRDPSGTMEER